MLHIADDHQQKLMLCGWAAFHLCSLLLMELDGRPSPETLHTQKLAFPEQETELSLVNENQE